MSMRINKVDYRTTSTVREPMTGKEYVIIGVIIPMTDIQLISLESIQTIAAHNNVLLSDLRISLLTNLDEFQKTILNLTMEYIMGLSRITKSGDIVETSSPQAFLHGNHRELSIFNLSNIVKNIFVEGIGERASNFNYEDYAISLFSITENKIIEILSENMFNHFPCQENFVRVVPITNSPSCDLCVEVKVYKDQNSVGEQTTYETNSTRIQGRSHF